MNSHLNGNWGKATSFSYPSGKSCSVDVLLTIEVLPATGFQISSSDGKVLHTFTHRVPWKETVVIMLTPVALLKRLI